jgi:hypothetical protein
MLMLRPALALLAIAVLSAGSSHAVTVYDTYPLGPGADDILVGQFMGDDLQYAVPFEVPLDAGDFALAVITLTLQHSPDPMVSMGDFTLRLREDAGGEPGAVLESWTHTDPVNVTDVDFVSVQAPELLAGETYWLNLKVEASTGRGIWNAANATGMDFLFATSGVLNPNWMTPTMNFPIGLARVETVPEPGQLLMLATGGALLAAVGRRRRPQPEPRSR